MVTIPKVQSTDRVVNQLQDNIIQGLTPITKNPYMSGRLIENVNLVVGSNSVNHGLGRVLQGWVIVRKRASADIYDDQDANPIPERTLILESDSIVSVNLYVF